MANIITELSGHNSIRITFAGRQGQHIRLVDQWTDWMLAMNDFRDLMMPISEENVDFIISNLLNNKNKLRFITTDIGQEYYLSDDKKIVRRLIAGRDRKQYQTVALFIKNEAKIWVPDSIEIMVKDILMLIRAMITLDCPPNYFLIDSLRNFQYLLSILWIKKKNPKLLQGEKRLKADEIFRVSLVK